MPLSKKTTDPFLSARVRAIAEQLLDEKNKEPPKRGVRMLRIPLEELGDEGINMNLSETGCHFVIRM